MIVIIQNLFWMSRFEVKKVMAVMWNMNPRSTEHDIADQFVE